MCGSRANHPPVHDPYSLRFTVLVLHKLHYLFYRSNISVSVEYLESQRQSFSACHKPDTDLHAVRTTVSAVAPLCLWIGFPRPLKICRRDIVDEKIEFRTEQLPISFLQMPAQCVLVRKKHIQRTLQWIK